ncbi:MAG: hypothetical protein JNL41_12640 [Phenylobacterium sp.]|uniref:hypothetical protein n=1 Tax=Phenylobacterium sp. TaxID=1871053 RepID=UPI001A4A241B|nr:hypothetical protein [Phenylobacterium sp.]MBL8555122.1 hypothetical protein [Phenylobacterium sp.]
MAVRPILLALGGALALSGCASSQYGYAYCYDPYGGPVGYYTGPFEPKPACARTQGAFVAQEGEGRRGVYFSGPYPGPVTGVPVDAVSREAAR